MIFKPHPHRPGTSLVELLMFLAFFALCSGILIGVLVVTSEQRVRQQTIAIVEQEGMQLMQMLKRRIRRAEQITYPAIGAPGSAIVLQLADEEQDPTIIALETGAIKVADGNDIRTLNSEGIIISDLQFQNTSVSMNEQSTTISFFITKTIPISTAGTYSRSFESLIILFPDHQRTGNGCSCSVPSCIDGVLSWGVCAGDTCEPSTESLPCL